MYSKEEIEMAIWKEFIKLYNKKFKTNFSCLRNWIQWKEADIICDNNLQIEIVSNQYSEEIKKYQEHQIKNNWKSSISLIEPDKNALRFLLKNIKSKNEKLINWNYWDFIKKNNFLLIDLRENCLTTMKDFSVLVKSIKLENINFNKIWLFHNRLITSKWDDICEKCLYNNNFCILEIYKI